MGATEANSVGVIDQMPEQLFIATKCKVVCQCSIED
jgi:hypothetical protein